MITNVNYNAQTSTAQAVATNTGASNTAGAGVENAAASFYHNKAELGEISKAQAEVTAMKAELMQKQKEVELLRAVVFSFTSPTTQEAADLQITRHTQLSQLLKDTDSLVKGIGSRMQDIMAAQATLISGLSIDDVARQEINNTKGEIRSMQAELNALYESVTAMMGEAARTGTVGHTQGLKLQESSDRMKFLRDSIDAKSGQVVAYQGGLIDSFTTAGQ